MLGILAGMFALLVWDRFPTRLVFMGALTASMTFKLAAPDVLLKGFSSSGVVTVAALFPVAACMYSAGAISLVSRYLMEQPRTLGAAQVKIMPPSRSPARFSTTHPWSP